MSEIIDVMRLFASGQIKFTKGEIKLLGQSVSFIPIDWIITLQKNLEKKNSDNVIYYAAKDMGVRWFKNMYNHFKISAEDVIRWGINILSVSGWGETSTPEINMKEKFYTVELKSGAEAMAFGKVNHAVDHFVRGCYASGAKVLFGSECDAVELECVSEGAGSCKFIAQPTEKFNIKDRRVARQLMFPKT